MNPNTEGWSAAEMFVTHELARLSGEITGMRGEMTGMRDDITTIRVDVAQKGALWGAISGTVLMVIGWIVKK